MYGNGMESFEFHLPGASANHFQMVDWNVEKKKREESGSLTAGQPTELRAVGL